MSDVRWSYSGNPSSSLKDQVRFLCGDTDQTDPLLLDGEINYLLSFYNNAPLNAAIRACETLQAKFSRMVDETVGSVSIKFSQRVDAMNKIKGTLIQRLATEGIPNGPYAGGISISDVISQSQNADRVRPDFTKHMMENQQISPWVTSQCGWLWAWQNGWWC